MKSTVLPDGVTPEQFVRVWQAADTTDDVSSTLGMAKGDACQYAGFLRRKGVPLKTFQFKNNQADYAALALLAQETQK